MLEEVNGQHFMMYHQQCYSLFTNKVGLERAEKRREKAVIQAETFDEPPAKKRATRKRRCWLRCLVVKPSSVQKDTMHEDNSRVTYVSKCSVIP